MKLRNKISHEVVNGHHISKTLNVEVERSTMHFVRVVQFTFKFHDLLLDLKILCLTYLFSAQWFLEADIIEK